MDWDAPQPAEKAMKRTIEPRSAVLMPMWCANLAHMRRNPWSRQPLDRLSTNGIGRTCEGGKVGRDEPVALVKTPQVGRYSDQGRADDGNFGRREEDADAEAYGNEHQTDPGEISPGGNGFLVVVVFLAPLLSGGVPLSSLRHLALQGRGVAGAIHVDGWVTKLVPCRVCHSVKVLTLVPHKSALIGRPTGDAHRVCNGKAAVEVEERVQNVVYYKVFVPTRSKRALWGDRRNIAPAEYRGRPPPWWGLTPKKKSQQRLHVVCTNQKGKPVI